MGIDLQRNVRVGVSDPFADRHDVNAGIDQLGSMGVSQRMEDDIRHADCSGTIRPFGTESSRPPRRSVNLGKYKIVVGRPAESETHAQFELGPAVLAEGIHDNIGQGDVPATSLGLCRRGSTCARR